MALELNFNEVAIQIVFLEVNERRERRCEHGMFSDVGGFIPERGIVCLTGVGYDE
jgi:hypothetical protein